jgi:hypothetical protein
MKTPLYDSQKVVADLIIYKAYRQKIVVQCVSVGYGRANIAANVSYRLPLNKPHKGKAICWLAKKIYCMHLRRFAPPFVTITHDPKIATDYPIVIAFFQEQMAFTPKDTLILLLSV